MQTQFFNYQVLDQSKLNELISNEKCIVIYDKKPNLEASNVCLCDLSTFKISSWKSNFNLEQREVVVFQLKNFSPDVVDSFFRNVYKRVIIFTSDTVFRDKIFGNPTYNTKINLIPNAACYFPVELQSNEAFKALISNLKNQSSDLSGKHITYLYHISACYYEFCAFKHLQI
ncbi:uncharacterized protein VICG_01951 [Vittaforma corneae ATCC 50505]|uniref:Uncharacterized protein n=1 Tax=Vittaforma corneae (strain ATCC 50505) TaxID=993615 RepID=L2GL19_VITCO|nr:uncharacterized protein VICG_01951 [Vittaforma corneae ATCC 50505]ELA40992.1 hypothetical protein VICG_01951 [Vittaforma corneae ATCC 50505]